MNKQRNAAYNILLNTATYMIQFIFSFITRKLIVSYIGIEILGINSVIVDTISMLSLCELGIQTSITYKLYGVIAANNYQRENALYAVLRKAYKVVGSVVFVCGLCVVPFINQIVNSSIDKKLVIEVYVIQIFIAALNYWVTCPRLLLLAHQRQYIYTSIDLIFYIIVFAVQVISIVLERNYCLFVTCSLIRTLGANYIIKKKCLKCYSYIDYSTSANKTDVKDMFLDLKEIIVGSLATFVYTSTDNFIISSIYGAVTVALIANYKVLTAAIKNVIELFSNTLAPFWGNYLNNEKSKDKILRLILSYNFMEFLLGCFLLVPLACLSDLFIEIWLSVDYIIICANNRRSRCLNGNGYYAYMVFGKKKLYCF